MSGTGQGRRTAWAEILDRMTEVLAQVLASLDPATEAISVAESPQTTGVPDRSASLTERLAQADAEVETAAALLADAEAPLRAWCERARQVTQAPPSGPTLDSV